MTTEKKTTTRVLINTRAGRRYNNGTNRRVWKLENGTFDPFANITYPYSNSPIGRLSILETKDVYNNPKITLTTRRTNNSYMGYLKYKALMEELSKDNADIAIELGILKNLGNLPAKIINSRVINSNSTRPVATVTKKEGTSKKPTSTVSNNNNTTVSINDTTTKTKSITLTQQRVQDVSRVDPKVLELQKQLAREGYYAEQLKDKSTTYIKNLQRNLGIKVDGIVGKETIDAYNKQQLDGIMGYRTKKALLMRLHYNDMEALRERYKEENRITKNNIYMELENYAKNNKYRGIKTYIPEGYSYK